MCGIVGFVSQRNFKSLQNRLPEAVLRLRHRGPDDSGEFFDPNHGIGLGHRRLSIIDLSKSGRQPMSSDNGDAVIVYNGEVYNFKEIRTTLEQLGHRFRTRTDTEVILKAYLQWGTACLERFIGMFAFAIWDGRLQEMILARDRVGIKPLFYCIDDGSMIFASELKGLVCFDEVTKEIDLQSLSLFLHYQYVPAPCTIFKGIRKLLPGQLLLFRKDKVTIETYWRYPYPFDKNGPSLDENESLEQLDALLSEAVSNRMVSDVPLGALLSGGVDSSVVVALMQKVNTAPIKTFCIGNRDKAYDEAPWAASVAKHLGTEHTELYITPEDALQIIPNICEIFDEPYGDSSAIPTFLVSRLTRSRVTVALSGDGGDEQFCGYVRYWATLAAADLFRHVPLRFRKVISDGLAKMPSGFLEKMYYRFKPLVPQKFSVENFLDKWQKLLFLAKSDGLLEFYRMTVSLWSELEVKNLLGLELPISSFEKAFDETDEGSLLHTLMRVDQKTYLPDAMLTKVDRASMAVGLEVRVPLLDHRVVEFTAGLSDNLLYRNGTGKYILRKLVSRYLPLHLVERPKMGFSIPVGKWFRRELKPLLTDYLSTSRLKNEGLFDSGYVQSKISEHLSGRMNHQHRLWSLLVWEMWRERWLRG